MPDNFEMISLLLSRGQNPAQAPEIVLSQFQGAEGLQRPPMTLDSAVWSKAVALEDVLEDLPLDCTMPQTLVLPKDKDDTASIGQWGRAAGPLLPLTLERERRPEPNHLVQRERRERPRVRLQADLHQQQEHARSLRGGEDDGQARSTLHPHVCERAGFGPEGEGAISHISSVRRWRRAARSSLSHQESRTASAFQVSGVVFIRVAVLLKIF